MSAIENLSIEITDIQRKRLREIEKEEGGIQFTQSQQGNCIYGIEEGKVVIVIDDSPNLQTK